MDLSTLDEEHFLIALLEIPTIGTTIAKNLIDEYGTAKAVFNQSYEQYKALGNVGHNLIEALEKEIVFNIAKEQADYCEENGISILSFYNKEYPQRLKHCTDAPLILYYKGNTNLNTSKVVSIVGTRNATPYGKKMCNNVIEELSQQNVLIVSGLAYGIDVAAHQEALNFNVPTVGVLAHGLDIVYPKAHTKVAQNMLDNGGLLTEHKIKTRPNRENFPKRNRIVAGMSDAVIVIESAITGGSMITAKLGNDYNRDVFAIPGRLGDVYSEGCNHLIKTNQAHLLQASKDIAYILGWKSESEKPKTVQKQLFVELNDVEQVIFDEVSKHQSISIDEIAVNLKTPISQVSTHLLMLEFKGLVQQLPGKIYELA